MSIRIKKRGTLYAIHLNFIAIIYNYLKISHCITNAIGGSEFFLAFFHLMMGYPIHRRRTGANVSVQAHQDKNGMCYRT